MRRLILVILGGLLAASPASAMLPLTGFETSEGYSQTGGVLLGGTTVTGTLIGQPSSGPTTWYTYSGDNRHAFVVRPGVGHGGTQGVLSQQLLGNALWNPTPGILDGVAQQFRFGLKFKFVDAPFLNGEEWDGFFGFRIDDTNANGSHFEVYLNAGQGLVRCTGRDPVGNALNVPLVDASNQKFMAQQGTWYEIHGFGDYVTDTYSVYVQQVGVPNPTVYKRENVPFRYHGLGFGQITPGPRVQDDDVVRLWQAKTDPQYYRQIALDDVYYGVIPEPASAGLMLLAAGGLLSRRTRRDRDD